MLGWAVGFFVAALVAALFGFGAIASTFADIAVLLFWVFVALFLITLVLSLFSRATSGDGHVSTGSGLPNGVGVALALVALVVLVFAWRDNHWTAEKVGRSLDHATANITADASDALHDAGRRVGDVAENTGHAVNHDTHEAVERAKH